MASIYKRGKTWYSKIRMGGKEVRKALSTDKDVALKKLADLLGHRRAARHGHAPINVSWDNFRQKVLAHSEHEKKESTWKAELRAVRWLERVVPIERLNQITPELMDFLKGKWVEAGRGKYVINRDLRSIRTLMRKGEAWGYIDKQDWTTNKYIKTPKGRLHYFTVEDLTKLRKVCRGIWHTILLLGARAGLRRQEMHTLRWVNIDFERNRIHIEATEEWTPKDNERRYIPMANDLRQHLIDLPKGSTFVLEQGRENRPMLGSMTNYFKRLVKRAKLKGNIHTLRHTFGSHLASRGVSPQAIQKMMGHSSLETTEIYMHLAPNVDEDAITKLPELGS